jgi:tetratricopeptide (TPR) repeat protein
MKKKRGWIFLGLLLLPALIHADQVGWQELFDQGVKALEAKKIEEAEQFFLQALTEARKEGKYSTKLSSTYMNLGFLYSGRSDYERASKMHYNALAIDEKVLGPEHVETAVSMANLADAYAHLARYKEAEALNFNALNILKKSGQSKSPVAIGILGNLKVMYQKQARQDLVKQIDVLLAEINKTAPSTKGQVPR